jgi:hypothetical protein
MKHSILIIYFFVQFPFASSSQSYEDSVIAHQSYLYDQFVDGAVLLKSGEVDRAPLNYCAYDQTILFKKEGTAFTLTGLTTVDTIYIADKKFIPVKNTVYEVATHTGKTDLLISYGSKINPMTAAADNNGITNQNAGKVNNTVTSVYVSRPFKGNYAIEITKRYWLKNFNNLYKINTAKDFIKAFKEGTAPAIKDYIQQHHPDFNKESDLLTLLNFCNQL